jgi:hypothetical protein
MMNKTPIYINADRLIDWIDAGHYRSPTEPVFSEQEIVHIIKQQPVCLVEPIIYAGLHRNSRRGSGKKLEEWLRRKTTASTSVPTAGNWR